MRNPPWLQDEILIALNFYLRHRPRIPQKTSAEISDLSELLKKLRLKLDGELTDTFRNNNGVYMKLMNLLRFDPEYEGTGLQRGGTKEKEVWERYASEPDELQRVVDIIRSTILSDQDIPPEDTPIDEEEAEEGTILTRLHKSRERNSGLVKRKKKKVLEEQGTLSCEVCDLVFELVYGERGQGFIECHHIKPLSELQKGYRTRMTDLALVCANCHRMIHRKKPWLSIEELKDLI